jgi:hypothetical protein
MPSSPTFYYPLNEHAPFLAENSLSVPAFRDSSIVFSFMNSLHLKDEWVRGLYRFYDPHRGFFHIDPVDPHINVGLPQIAQRLFILRTYGFLDNLEQYIPNYSPDDVENWLLRSVFAHAKNPFRKKSIYRYRYNTDDPFLEITYLDQGITERMSCEDISSTLEILHLLGRFQRVADFCDPVLLGKAFAGLQGADGLIRPSLDPDPRDRSPGDTALHALVAINLLALHFGIDVFDEIRVQDLANSLTSLARAMLKQPLEPHSLHTLYALAASLHLLGDRVDFSVQLFERIEDAMMLSLGLLDLWKVYKTENPAGIDAFYDGLEFVSTLATSNRTRFRQLTRKFPAGKTAEAGWFSLFPTVAAFSALGAAGGVGVLLGIISGRFVESPQLTWSFDWNSLTLPLVLRHYPLIEVTELPLLWFRGESDVVLPLRNVSASPVTKLIGKVEAVQKRNQSIFYSTRGGRKFRVKLKALKTPRRLAPNEVGSVILRVDARWGYPRYPKLELPGLPLRCSYGDREWDLLADRLFIQVLPRRSRVTGIVSREATKARYQPSWTIRAIKGSLREGGEIFANEVLAKHLYREFLPFSVENWIRQFEPNDRPAILKLHRALRYYSIEETRELLKTLLSSLPLEIVRHAAFLGVGKHLAKSGTHLLYFVKHAYREICSSVPSKEVSMRFQPFDVMERAMKARTLAIRAIILVDDFFGSGKTTTDDLSRLAKKPGRLWSLPKYYLAVTGFDRGLQRIVASFPEMKQRVLIGSILSDRHRAFAWPSTIFSDRKEWREAKKTCASVGEALLRTQFTSQEERKRHALGWDNDQALIAFEHNTPNNTLPIFWAKGRYQGSEWQPLYRRRE